MPEIHKVFLTAKERGNTTPWFSYCGVEHSSKKCPTVTDPSERKKILRRKGKCYLCFTLISNKPNSSCQYYLEKAFIYVEINGYQRDLLKCFWIQDVDSPNLQV